MHRTNPFTEMQALHHRLTRPRPVSQPAWTPPVDLIEDRTGWHVLMELPGLGKQDIQVRVEGDLLHVSGERPAPERTESRVFLRSERRHGCFGRRFRLPQDADPGSVTAEFQDGLLQINLLRREETLPRTIDIRVG